MAHDEQLVEFESPHDGNALRDIRLAELIDKIMAEARAGTPVDIERWATENPEFADDLRQLWGVAEVAEEFGSLIPSYDELDDAGRNAKADGAPSSFGAGSSAQTFGDYELFEELGRGGMGVVYRARQKSLDRIVALKIVLGGAAATRADLARFRGEAETAARLNHPNIVPVYDVGQHDGLPYFTMRFVRGTTLAQRLADGPLPGREAAELLAPVVRAIAKAHRQGVLHRDLKPSNILIDAEGRPYVSDFGLAKRLLPEPTDDPRTQPHQANTQTGAILGTPGYMSPEQAAGRRGVIGSSTDIYSLGAILYAMLTGRPPFQAASPVDTVMLVLEQDPISPQVLNPRVDRDLEMIALKCLQKPTELRYATADGLAADLEAYLADEPVSARSSRFTQILTRAFRETHHVSVLENWGLLWILHAVVLLTLCIITNAFQLSGVTARWPYIALWTVGLGTWAAIFWNLRRRSGPITFVERQIAHVWAGSMIADTFMYVIEFQLGLPVLTLSPMLGPVSGAVFLMKAAMLSGKFYIYSAVLCLTGLVMAWLQTQTYIPNIGLTVFGIVSAVCFFLPGWKYYRQVRRDR
ncbi:MAG: serine/threonine protein kinase [Planctomycetes bacterium]|nr:serine/threonine protein kinase [Planctomycetota bacterium]